METNVFLGVLLVSIGAVFGGTFALPSKYVENSPWEFLWGLFFFFATLLIPATFTALYWTELSATWSAASTSQLFAPVFFGFLWGLGSFFCGRAFSMAGLSLAYALNMGMQQSFGPVIPLLNNYHDTPGPVIVFIALGIVVCLVGIFFCGRAGMLKEQAPASTPPSAPGKLSHIRLGIVFALVGGTLASCINLSFAYGAPIMEFAMTEFGNDPAKASLSVWILALAGGSLSTFGYCLFLFFKNDGISRVKTEPMKKLVILALMMAVLHDGALFFYGLGANHMGKLGTSIGFAIFASGMMLVGNATGFFTGEWKDVERKSTNLLVTGLVALVCGIILLAYANFIDQISS